LVFDAVDVEKIIESLRPPKKKKRHPSAGFWE